MGFNYHQTMRRQWNTIKKTGRLLLCFLISMALFACIATVESTVTPFPTRESSSTPIPTNKGPATLAPTPANRVTLTAVPENAATPIPVAENVEYFIDSLNFAYERDLRLSPNGRWLARPIFTNAAYLVVNSTLTPTFSITSTPVTSSASFSFLSWSPDSTAMVYAAADEGCSHCPFHRFVIFSLDESQQQLTGAEFALPPRDDYVVNPVGVWSADSSKLAIISSGHEIVILDQQARVSSQITIENLADKSISSLYLADSSLFYATWERIPTNFPNISITTTWYTVDLASLQTQQLMNNLEYGFKRIEIIDDSPEGDHVLISAKPFGYDPYDRFKLLIFNLNTKQVEQTLVVPGRIGRIANSSPLPITAIQTYGPQEESLKLLLFDWETRQLLTYGEGLHLIRWNPDLAGFLVINEQTSKGPVDNVIEFEVIKP